jgi:hypothetical protein
MSETQERGPGGEDVQGVGGDDERLRPSQDSLEKENQEAHLRRLSWAAQAAGFNVFAKQQDKLGARMFYALLAQDAEKQFVALGGHTLFTHGKTVLVLEGSGLYIRFEEHHIELMRKAVQEYDEQKAKQEQALEVLREE